MCAYYLKGISHTRVLRLSPRIDIFSRSAVTKTRRQKLLDNEIELKSIPPPKGDPSWHWYEELPAEQADKSPKTQKSDSSDSTGNADTEEETKERGSPQIKFAKFGDRMVELPVALKDLVLQRLQGSTLETVRADALKIFASNRSLSEVAPKPKPTPKSQDEKSDEPIRRYGHKRPDLDSATPHAISFGSRETLAYLAGIMPSTYSTLHRVMSEVKMRDSKFNPTRILDFGTGPGTSLWALGEIWGKEHMKSFRGVDLSESMLEVASDFAKTFTEGTKNFGCEIRFDRHFSYLPGEAKYDLVIASNVFSEYPSDALRVKALESLWDQCEHTLILIERGTPKGFHIINQARELLKTCESHIMAPCSQEKKCPLMNSTKSCHFQQQLQRPKFMMDVKGSKSNQEISNYSYIVLRKGPRPEKPEQLTDIASFEQSSFHWGRILDKPSKNGKHIKMNICSPEGVVFKDSSFTKAQGDKIFRDARKASWGDLFPHPTKVSPRLHLPSSFKKRARK